MHRAVRWSLALGIALAPACSGSSAPFATDPPVRTLASSPPEPTLEPEPSTNPPVSTSVITARPSTTDRPAAAQPIVATTTTAAPGPRTISLAFTGDTLVHSPLWRRAERNANEAGRDGHDFGPMLAGLAPLLDTVDLAICHLETPIAPAGEEFSTEPRYGVPPGIADALAAAGFDRCSTASNHTADRGAAGIDRTIEVLATAGITQAGMASRPGGMLPRVVDVSGVAVSHLSYTWSYNGLSLPEGEEWRSALIDPDRIVRDASIARSIGAEVVVVSLHWGDERVHEPTRYQRDIADAITADGSIDLVVGHHAHVLQPIERVNETWVLFGLGNILSNLPTGSRWPAASQDAAVVTVELTVDPDGAVAVGRPEVHPTWVDRDAGWVVRLVAAELARDDLSTGQRGRLERSWARTDAVVGDFVVGEQSPARLDM